MPARNQPLDLGLDPPGEFDLGAGDRDAIERRAPALDVLAVVGLGKVPQLDQARPGIGQRVVDRVADVGRVDAAVDRRLAKHMVDRLQDRRSRPERIGEGDGVEGQAGIEEALLQIPPALVELVRGGALEREDRLLLVADREDRPHDAVAGALAGGELRDQMEHDVPLPGTGVLRLVDQHVVDAAVELVMHPARGHPVEHRERPVDQVVIVEQPALRLFAPVVHRRGRCDVEQRPCAVADRERPALLDQRAEAAALGLDQGADRRVGLDELLGHHRGAWRALLGEEDRKILVDLGAAGEDEGLAQLVRLLLVGLAAAIEGGGDVLPAPARKMGTLDHGAFDLFDRFVRTDS